MSELRMDENGVITPCPQCGARNRIAFENLNHGVRCGRCKSPLPGPAAPVTVESEEHFNVLIGLSSLPVLVDFWAPWCGPCKMVAPEFEKVAANSAGEILVAKVNTEEQPSLAHRYAIQSIPTLILFHGGQETARSSGARPAADIVQFVQQNFATSRAV